ncbi:MAG TPA: M1 family aminopeptidase [Bryobacteraceae bacterium]|nr:M1 family aminopeptidase [Bryobacteraceae bacterium]
MIRAVAIFEIDRRVRAISTYVYFLLFAPLACLIMAATAGGIEGASVSFGGGGKVLANSPFTLANLTIGLSLFGLLVTAAVMGSAVYGDFECRIDPLIFTSRAGKTAYLAGRFLAASAVLILVFSGIGTGLWLGTLMPGLDHVRLGANHWTAYVAPYLSVVIPNVVILGALFFSVAVLSRRILPVYMISVLLLAAYLIAGTITHKIEHKFLAALVDPFGMTAFGYLTEYWTIVEKNTRVPGLEGFLLWNRLLWLALAGLLMGFTWWKFRMEHRAPAQQAARVDRSLLPRAATYPTWLHLTWMQFVETVKNIYFAVIVLAGAGFMVVSARTLGSIYGTPTYPVTYQVLELVGGTFALFILITITFYSGELVWRERDAGVNEIVDSMPLPGWSLWLSKLFALMLVQVLLECVLMVTGMAIQLAKGYSRLEPGLYLKDLFGLQLYDYWLVCALALAVHTLVNHKYLGHLVMVVYYLAYAFMDQFGFEHHLYNYSSHPDHDYSDMNGYGHFLGPVFWYYGYWSALAILLGLAVHLFWVRGLASGWRSRWSFARARFQAPQRKLAVAAGICFAAIGGFIFYNTNVLNPYRTRSQREKLQLRYEREYKAYEKSPGPMITTATLRVDLEPDQRRVRIHGHYDLANKFSEPISEVLLDLPQDWTIHTLRFSPEAHLERSDRALQTQTYRMAQPWPAGASGELEFDIEWQPHGFPNDTAPTDIVANGTFFNSGSLPQFGYDANGELSEDDTRRKYGLAPKPRAADIHDVAARRFTYISHDADWVQFEAVISTAPDQIAVAPGELVRDWSEGGRHLFQYRSRGKILNFFSVLSARYRVLRDRWNDVDLAIYYHPGHEYNLARMMKGVKASLDYCTRNFSPYQNKTVRIVEFPRYDQFAQSFPASIPYSESIGFIARVDPADEEDVDYPFYGTAHEVAHQWWAHQVIGGDVQGATVMSESLAQYTALMVMKQEYGPEHMKRFLKYEMDRYLGGRSSEKKQELPLIRCEGQSYIRYNKASVVFYALQDYVGEEAINRALRGYVQDVAFQEPPYTNALELEARLRAVMPAQYGYLIDDMFDAVTLYENRALSASWRTAANGKYEVKLKVAARKLKASEQGEEREVPLADWIDIGVFGDKEKLLYLQKHKIDRNEQEFTLLVDAIPVTAGIDPWNKLVDRSPDDNTIKVERQQ